MGAGGGRGSGFSIDRARSVQELITESQRQASQAATGTEVADFLNQCLKAFNDRDVASMRKRLDELKESLRDVLEEGVDLLLSGSVAKHTYVDGLSDVDALIVIKYAGDVSAPRGLLEEVTADLRRQLAGRAEVSHGRLAVSIRYTDGMEIQLIPAVRTSEGLRVPSWESDKWSDIDPERFTRALTKRNAECGQRLVPTIKLAKAINSTLPESEQLTGYHIESLAIAAFRGYRGPTVLPEMLSHFLKSIPALLQSPIIDRTGQSVHVDEYLGPARSEARRDRAHLFEGLSKRLETALAAGSISNLGKLLGS
jgi:hypothetical protein